MSSSANEPTRGLRQQKKETTRGKLLDAALILIEKRGYDATSIDDIVQRAGVAKRTFFRYYGSKDDVLVEWVGRFGEHLCESLVARPKNESPAVALQRAMISSIHAYESLEFMTTPLERAINTTPAILARKLLKLKLCADSLSRVLSDRMKGSGNADFAASVLAHCAIAALLVASDIWQARGSGSGSGKLSLVFKKTFSQMKIELGAIESVHPVP